MNRPRLPPADILRLLVLGLAIREALSFWTGHPFDSEVWLRNAYYVSQGWSPYSFMPPVPGLSFAYATTTLPSVGYLPLWSLLLGGLYRVFAWVPGASPFVLYWLLKQPPIAGDMALGYLMYLASNRWGGLPSVSRRVLTFWMIFPYSIIISAVWGQFDAIVAALMMAAILASASWRRASLLGLGILFKLLPVIFVPYEFLRAKGRSRGMTVLAVAVPVAFTAAVFAITSWTLGNFTGTVTFAGHGSPQGLTYGGLLTSELFSAYVAPYASALGVLGWLWVPGVLIGAWLAHRRLPGDTPSEAVQVFAFLTVVLFLLRWEVNEQYLLYLLPLLLLDVELWHPERRALFHATWIIAMAFLVVNNFFLVRFLQPVTPAALAFELGLDAVPAFVMARDIALAVLAVVFSVHLVQLGMVLMNPKRSTTPWIVLALRRTWAGSFEKLRALGAGRGG